MLLKQKSIVILPCRDVHYLEPNTGTDTFYNEEMLVNKQYIGWFIASYIHYFLQYRGIAIFNLMPERHGWFEKPRGLQRQPL